LSVGQNDKARLKLLARRMLIQIKSFVAQENCTTAKPQTETVSRRKQILTLVFSFLFFSFMLPIRTVLLSLYKNYRFYFFLRKNIPLFHSGKLQLKLLSSSVIALS
jgi:hypothetical protein